MLFYLGDFLVFESDLDVKTCKIKESPALRSMDTLRLTHSSM